MIIERIYEDFWQEILKRWYTNMLHTWSPVTQIFIHKRTRNESKKEVYEITIILDEDGLHFFQLNFKFLLM